jgi:hypothetical protein
LITICQEERPWHRSILCYLQPRYSQSHHRPISFAFQVQIGIPHVSNPSSLLPNIVTLGSATFAVQFNMLCYQFNVVQLGPGNKSWLNMSQPANSPWVFASKVNMHLSTVNQSECRNLPPNVQQGIKNLGNTAFSVVQQLIFDLSNVSLTTIPVIAPGTVSYILLQQYFLGAYFTQLQVELESRPLLGCSIVVQNTPVSTISLTNLNFNVNPYMNPTTLLPYPNLSKDQQRLATLNYLCAANGNAIPPSATFPWNWVDASRLNNYDGVISINRDTLANYFRNQLASYVPKYCILPSFRLPSTLVSTYLNQNAVQITDEEEKKSLGFQKIKEDAMSRYEPTLDARHLGQLPSTNDCQGLMVKLLDETANLHVIQVLSNSNTILIFVAVSTLTIQYLIIH